MGNRILITICFSLLSGILIAQENTELSIDSCYSMSKQNYPAIKQFELIKKSTEFTISNANRNYLPQISLTGIGGYIGGLPSFAAPGTESSDNGNFKFIGIGQLNQVIWDGGISHVQKKISNTGYEVENANLETILYSLRERVNQVYFGVLLLDEQLKHLNDLRENLERTFNKVKLSKENGIAYQSDVDEVKAELMLLDQKEIELLHIRKGYVQVLALLIGKTLPENIQLYQPVVIQSAEHVTNNRPELKLFDSRKKLIESQSSINNAQNMPKLGLVGYGIMLQPETQMGASSVSSFYVAGLSLSWSTANLYKSPNSKNIDKIQIDRIDNELELFLFNTNLQLKQTYYEIEKYRAVIEKDNEIIVLKEKIKKAYQLKYDNGICSMNDLLNSIYKEGEAKNNQALHKVQLSLSQYTYNTQSGN